jgi:hypothetical protein
MSLQKLSIKLSTIYINVPLIHSLILKFLKSFIFWGKLGKISKCFPPKYLVCYMVGPLGTLWPSNSLIGLSDVHIFDGFFKNHFLKKIIIYFLFCSEYIILEQPLKNFFIIHSITSFFK